MFGNGFPDDWSALKRLIWLRLMLGPGSSRIIKTVKGAIAHMTDALARLAIKIVASIEPVQDLHGQDAPWPPGGGKNLIDLNGFSSPYASATPIEKGVIVTITTAGNNRYVSYNLPLSLLGKTVTLHADVSVGSTNYASMRIYYYSGSSTVGDSVLIVGGTGSRTGTVTIPDSLPEGTEGIRLQLYGGTTGTTSVDTYATYDNLQLEIGSTPTAWSPYANECPISGHTGCEVVRTGKNLCSQVLNGLISIGVDTVHYYPNNDCRSLVFNCKAGQTYIASGLTMNRFIWAVFDSAPTSGSQPIAYQAYAQPQAFTPTKDGVCILYVSNTPVDTSAAQVELGSNASSYEPYSGTTVTVSFGQTVYGGQLTVFEDGSGQIVADRIGISTTWGDMTGATDYDVTQMRVIMLTTPPDTSSQARQKSISNIAAYVNNATDTVHYQILNSGSAARFYLPKSTDTTTPVQLVYYLATPIVYTLPDVTILSMVLGTNNIWVDTGDTEVTYYADGEASTSEALGILLGGAYHNSGTDDDATDDEALGILLGGS